MAKLLCCFLLLFALGTKAQNVVVNSDPLLYSLVQQNIDHNKQTEGVQGYRVQIYFGSERKGAQDARQKFMQTYPETEAYLIYQQPYFKVRVGDYRDRFEAQAIYKKLLHEFDKVFIVPDRINFPKL